MASVHPASETDTKTVDPVDAFHEVPDDDGLRRMAQRAEIFERILQRSPAILLVVRHDPTWTVEYVSENVDRLGFDRDEFLADGRGLADIVHPDDRERVLLELEFWSDDEQTEDFRLEFRCATPDLAVRWMDTHLWSRRDASGQVRRLQGIAWDITERKRAERMQRLAVQVVELLNCPSDSLEISRNILEMMRFYAEIESAAIHLRTPEAGTVCISSGFDHMSLPEPETCPLLRAVLEDRPAERHCGHRCCLEDSDHAMDLAITTGGSLWSNRASSLLCLHPPSPWDPRTGEPAATIGSFAVIPLRAGGTIVGTLQLCDRRRDVFDARAVEAFEGLGFSIGIALEREATTRDLEQSEERYRTLFDTSSDGILMLTLDHRIEAVNNAFALMTQRRLDELCSMPRWTFLRSSGPVSTSQCIPGQLLRDGFTDDFDREVIRPDGTTVPVTCRSWVVRDNNGSPLRILLIARDVTEQRRAQREVLRLATAIEQSDEIVIITDVESRIEYVNPTFERISGFSREEAIGSSMTEFRDPRAPVAIYESLRARIRSGQMFRGRVQQRHKDGRTYHVDQTISPVRDHHGRITNFVAVQRDVTEFMQLEAQLLQAQKLESIGRLAAGIAHEINTPAQYVGDNVHFLKGAFEDFMRVMHAGAALTEAARGTGMLDELVDQVTNTVHDIDFDYLVTEIPQAIDQSLEGLDRVSTIVKAMKFFSHPGAKERAPIDIHQAIESTVTVARNEWKYDCELDLDFDPDMPLVPCLPNEFNQVVLNLLINAVHAVQDRRADEDPKGRIVVRTRVQPPFAVIEVEDDGVGIPASVEHRVFDPFFTTKEVGRGTGQGLSLAREVIRKKHGGDIEFRSVPGRGTTFCVRIPLESTAAAPVETAR